MGLGLKSLSRDKLYDWKWGGGGGWNAIVWKYRRIKIHEIIKQNFSVRDQGCKGREGEEPSD